MNKKGFTLVELLAVIVIIGLLSGIAVVAYNTFIDNARERVYKTYEDTMKAEAEMYLIDNSSMIPAVGGQTRIEIEDLGIDPIQNPDDSNDLCLNSYVKITRGANIGINYNLTYDVCLKCNSYKSAVCE